MRKKLTSRIFVSLFFATLSQITFLQGQTAYTASPIENFSQEYAIKGKVIDESSQAALEFVTVQVFSIPDSSLAGGGISDEFGNFNIPIKAGQYRIVVSYISYEAKVFPKIILDNQNPVANLGKIVLAPESTNLQEVQITAQRSAVQMELDKRVFEIDRNLVLNNGTAVDILNNLPSVQVDVDGNVSLRGSQNVRILINGKPSGLGTGSPDALRLLQSNLIERVEVVTNPSARYDAEGEVGIINIILKKDKRAGINGAFDVSIGTPHNHNIAYNLNLRKGWINLFSSFGLSYRDAPGGGNSFQQLIKTDSLDNVLDTLITRRTRSTQRGDLGTTFRTGADIYINDFNTLTVAGLYRYSVGDNDSRLTYDDYNGQDILQESTYRDQFEDENSENIELSLNYKKTFEKEGQEWSADLRWFVNGDTELADIIEQNVTDGSPKTLQRSNNTEDEANWFIQSDYIHPFGEKNRFETGFRATLRTINNNYLVEEQNESGIWQTIAGFDNQFEYQENIYAGYAILSGEINRFTWQLGLRGEYSDITTTLKKTNESTIRQYFNPFPSMHVSYKLNENSDLQLSYSRRISRPRFRELLPFSNFSDARNFRAGNPALNPEYTNSLEVSYLRNWKTGSLLSSVYYRYRTGVIERINLLQDVTNSNDSTVVTTVAVPINLSIENNTGFEFNLEQDLARWWNMSANVNVYYSSSNGKYNETDYSRETITMNGRFNSKITLKKWFDFQTNINYEAPQRTTQGRAKSMTSIDLGLARDVLKGKGTITLSVRDLLNSRKWRGEVIQPNYYSNDVFQWRRRQVTLGFNYRLNQNKKRNERPDRERGEGEGQGNDF